MVTKRNRVTAEAGLGTPAAATFQAQNVPMIGAQRRESQASNYERLAQSLGAFSNALGGFGASLDARMKKEAEGQEQAVKDFIAVNDMSPDDRLRARANFGTDPNTDKLLGAATAEKYIIPQAEQAEMEVRKNWTSNGWQYETGQVMPDPSGEETPVLAPITPEYLAQEREAANEAIKAQYPDPKDAFIRNKLYAHNDQTFSSRVGELVKFREAENLGKYEEIMAITGPSAVRQLGSSKDADGTIKGVIEYGMKMAQQTGVKMSEKDFTQKYLPAVLKSLAQDAENDPNLTPVIEKLVTGKFGPGQAALIDTPRYKEAVKELLDANLRGKAKAEFQSEADAQYTEIFKALESGKKIDEITINEIKKTAPGQALKLTEKEVKEALARRQDERVMTVDGVVAKVATPAMLTSLASESAKTGITSPTLKKVFEGSLFEGDTSSDESASRINDALSAYDAIKRFNPLGVENYMKKADVSRLERIHSLIAVKGVDVKQATEMAMKVEQAGGYGENGGFTTFKSINKKAVKALKETKGLNESEHDDILKDAYAILSMDADGVTPEDVVSAVDRAKDSRLAMRPMVYGTVVKLPRGVDPEAGKMAMTSWYNYAAGRLKKAPDQIYSIQRPDGTYAILDRASGMPVYNDDGRPATFTFDQAQDRFMADVEQAKREDRAAIQKKIDDAKKGRDAWTDPKNPINRPRSSSGPSAADTRAKPTDVFDVRGKKVK